MLENLKEELPTRFLGDRYDIVRSLGKGGMGEVFEVVDHELR